MEFLAFDKMDREMDEVLAIYMDLGGEKFDTNFRNTRKDLKTLYADLKEGYLKVGREQAERDKKLDSQKQTMEYKTLDFRIKSGIVRLGLDMIDIEREITRYCKENNIHNERFFNKYEAEARKEARGGNVSDITQSFGTHTQDDGFEDEDFEGIYNDLNASSVNSETASHGWSASGSSRPVRKASEGTEVARPKVNKDLLNEEEKLVQEMVESVENFEACLAVLIKKEVFYQLAHGRTDDWHAKIPDRFKRKIRHFRDLLQNEAIPEEDEEYDESEPEAPQPEFLLEGVEQDLAEEKPPPVLAPAPKMLQSAPPVKKELKLTAEEEMALDLFEELDAKMDDNLRLVSDELTKLGQKLDDAEGELDRNAEMINEIDVGTQNVLTDVRDQNRQMKELVSKFREPNKLICDIILILVLCLFIGIFIFLLKRYFEIKDMIETLKSAKKKGSSANSRRLLII